MEVRCKEAEGANRKTVAMRLFKRLEDSDSVMHITGVGVHE